MAAGLAGTRHQEFLLPLKLSKGLRSELERKRQGEKKEEERRVGLSLSFLFLARSDRQLPRVEPWNQGDIPGWEDKGDRRRIPDKFT